MPLEVVHGKERRPQTEAEVFLLAPFQMGQDSAVCAVKETADQRSRSFFQRLNGKTPPGPADADACRHSGSRLLEVGVPQNFDAHLVMEALVLWYRSILEETTTRRIQSVEIPLLGADCSSVDLETAVQAAMTAILPFLQSHELQVVLLLPERFPLRNRYGMLEDLRQYLHAYESGINGFALPAAPAQEPQSADAATHALTKRRQAQKAPEKRDTKEERKDSGRPFSFGKPASAHFPLKNTGVRKSAAAKKSGWFGSAQDSEGVFEACTKEQPMSAGHEMSSSIPSIPPSLMQEGEEKRAMMKDLQSFLGQSRPTFQQKLMQSIQCSSMSEVEVYKKANLSRKHFSKIRINPFYQPRKSTVIALAFALEMNLEETQELLESSGFTLSFANRYDLIIRYFIEHQIFDLFYLNEVLYAYNQPTI